jgi:hypothetical protein
MVEHKTGDLKKNGKGDAAGSQSAEHGCRSGTPDESRRKLP